MKSVYRQLIQDGIDAFRLDFQKILDAVS